MVQCLCTLVKCCGESVESLMNCINLVCVHRMEKCNKLYRPCMMARRITITKKKKVTSKRRRRISSGSPEADLRTSPIPPPALNPLSMWYMKHCRREGGRAGKTWLSHIQWYRNRLSNYTATKTLLLANVSVWRTHTHVPITNNGKRQRPTPPLFPWHRLFRWPFCLHIRLGAILMAFLLLTQEGSFCSFHLKLAKNPIYTLQNSVCPYHLHALCTFAILSQA